MIKAWKKSRSCLKQAENEKFVSFQNINILDGIWTEITARASNFCLQPRVEGLSGGLLLLNYQAVGIGNCPLEIGWLRNFIVILTKFHANLIALKFCERISGKVFLYNIDNLLN